MDLSDKAWRVFTNALMWSAEQGTDGRIPARYVRLLHPDADLDDAIAELSSAGMTLRDDDGLLLPGWGDKHMLGQSTAEQVRNYREKARDRQRKHRDVPRDRHQLGATQIETVQPGHVCPDDRHKLVADGTCALCDYRPDVIA